MLKDYGVQLTASATRSRILVVDDDPKLSRLVKLVLEKTKMYEVCEENSALRALPTARRFKPHAVLMDVDMPGKDGGQVAQEMAEDPELASLPLLFLTSLVSGTEADEHEVELGGKLFLAKPVDAMALLDSVGRLVNRT